MKRREFVMLVGGAVAGWPHAAHPRDRLPSVAPLRGSPESDPETRARVACAHRMIATSYSD